MVTRICTILAIVVGTFGINAVTITKCAPKDKACLLQSVRSAYKQITAGVPELGIESSDPLHVDFIDAGIHGLSCKLTNVTFEGFNACDVYKANYNPDTNKFTMEMACKIHVTGQYELNGRLLVLPVEGKGDFISSAKKEILKFNVDVQRVESKGATRLAIKKFTFDFELPDKLIMEFKNLFNGNKQLSDAVHKLANDNYKEIAKDLNPPILNVALKKLSTRFNKFLKNTPIEDLIL